MAMKTIQDLKSHAASLATSRPQDGALLERAIGHIEGGLAELARQGFRFQIGAVEVELTPVPPAPPAPDASHSMESRQASIAPPSVAQQSTPSVEPTPAPEDGEATKQPEV